MKKQIVSIAGMHCRSCELLLEEHLGRVPGVQSVQVSYRSSQAIIDCGTRPPNDQVLDQAVRAAGYRIGVAEKPGWLSRHRRDYGDLGLAALVLLALYFIARWTGLLNITVKTEAFSLPFAVVIGLVAGVSTCMAVVGGLILGISARYGEQHPDATATQKFKPHFTFNLGRILGYALFGGILGALGGVLKLSTGMLAFLTVLVGVVMMFVGVKLTGMSPRLKQTSITLPTGIARWFGLGGNRQSQHSTLVTGALTFFLPCGFTQAMQLYAISTGSPIRGALVLSLFALGTAPALLSIGGLTAVVKGVFARRFYAAVGLAVLLFGFFNIRHGLALSGVGGAAPKSASSVITSELKNGVQTVRMTQSGRGYSPRTFTIQTGVPVRWIVTSTSPYSCASSLFMPKMNISRQLTEGENVIEFTPTSTGALPFSCSMGMYTGSFKVIDQGVTSDVSASSSSAAPKKPAPTVAAAPSCGGGSGGCGCGGGGATKPKPAPTADTPTATVTGDVQKISSRDAGGQLEPGIIKVKAGVPVQWTVEANGPPVGCMTAFVSPALGIDVNQARQGKTVIEFTPEIPGDYEVTCGMGMWRGSITVTN